MTPSSWVHVCLGLVHLYHSSYITLTPCTAVMLMVVLRASAWVPLQLKVVSDELIGAIKPQFVQSLSEGRPLNELEHRGHNK